MKKAMFVLLLVVALTTSLVSVARNKVVVEVGTGTWCVYCPYAAVGVDALVENGHQVAVIENHNGDPYATTASNYRNTYYGISSYPTVYFDGTNPSAGVYTSTPMYNYYLPKVNTRLGVTSHFTISATGGEVDNNYSINVLVNKVEEDANTNVILHAVVTESHIQQVWQGQTHLEFVERLMLPTHTGTPINLATGGEITVPLTFTTAPTWAVNNCELVLFLQNNTTKEILQGAKYSFAELFGAYPISEYELNFPDTYLTNSATKGITLNNYWNQVITGTVVSNNAVFNCTASNRMNFTLQPYQSMDVGVTFTPAVVGTSTGILTITSNFPDNAVINIPLSGYGFANAAPVASEVAVSGVPVVSMNLTGSYLFSDPDANTEGTSVYQWYRISAIPEPQLIPGATAITYHTVPADIGYALAFQITPIDQHGMAGTPIMSSPSPVIENLPAPQNLTAVVQNEQDVLLDWDPPIHFSRNFLGYRIFRSGLIINTIMNPATTTFTDTWLANGDYEYWITSIFDNPIAQSEATPVVNVHIGPVSNDDNVITAIESVQIFPNPVRTNSSVVIKGKANSNVKAEVYNTKGQLVSTLKGMTDASGISSLGLNDSGNMLPGIYFVRVNSAKGSMISKFIVMK